MHYQKILASFKRTAALLLLMCTLTLPTLAAMCYSLILKLPHQWTDALISVFAIGIAYSLYLKKVINHSELYVEQDTLWKFVGIYIGTTFWLTLLFSFALFANFADHGAGTDVDKVIINLYYCISTLTTLGYGDLKPYNLEGMIIASAMALLGTANMIFPIAIITAKLSRGIQLPGYKQP